MGSRQLTPAVPLLGALIPLPALAHIKWFVDVDPADAPRRMDLVLNETFWLILFVASVALFITYLIDIRWSRWRRFDWIGRHFSDHRDIATTMVRICVGVLCVALWLIGHVLLTPELTSDWSLLPSLHVVTALCVLFERTLIISGLGILILYTRGVVEYGLFHMLDYLMFLGIAGYLGLSSVGSEALKRHRLPWLVTTTLVSFLWVTIEKLAYPQWFDPFLDSNPMLTMGLPREPFLICAAFVEFTLVYVMLTGRNMAVVGAVALNLLIIAGALYFGKVDTIGHFPIIVILAIIAIKGPSAYQFIPYRDGRGPMQQAGLLMLGYWFAWTLMFLLYYGVHSLQYPCGG